MRQLLGAAQQSLDESQPLAQGLDVIIGFGLRMWQRFAQQPNPPAAPQKGPERCRPGVRAELLLGELYFYGLAGTFGIESSMPPFHESGVCPLIVLFSSQKQSIHKRWLYSIRI